MEKQKRSHIFFIYIVLVLATIAAFEPVRKNDFIRLYDDAKCVTDNPNIKGGLNLKSVRWAFTTPHYYMWHPLTTLSNLLEYQLFGPEPFWFHLTNFLLHTVSVVLLFWVLKKMTGALWPSAFTAAVFALHPIQVESVAWIAERKNVLSGFFWLLTMAAYIRYAQRPNVSRYLVVLFVFALSTMTKPSVVTLPFVLLLLDYWPLRRTGMAGSAWRLIVEKIPLFVFSGFLSIVTFLSQQSGSAVKPEWMFPLNARVLNALVSYIRYIGKIIYPSGLAVFYPHLGRSIPTWQPTVSFLLLVIISVVVFWQVRRRPYLVVGWLWFVGTLVPVIGLVQVGGQAMADRYAYIPIIGICIMAVWAADEIVGKWRRLRAGAAISAGLILCILLFATRTQAGYWQDDYTLFSHAVKVTKNNHLAYYNLGKMFQDKGQYDEAVRNYKETVRIDPGDYEAWNNMGTIFYAQGKIDQAISSYKQSLKANPNYTIAIFNEGLARLKQREYGEAISQFGRVLKMKPDWPEAHNYTGDAYVQLGNYDLAVKHYEEAIKLRPDYLTALYSAGMASRRQGEYSKAVSYFRRALEQKPDSVVVMNSLAWTLATVEDGGLRNSAEAVKYAEKACGLSGNNNASLLDTLAAAYASAGDFERAAATAEKAFKLAESHKQIKLAQEIQGHLELYKAKQPLREHIAVPRGN